MNISELSELKDLLLAIHEYVNITLDVDSDEVYMTVTFMSGANEIAYVNISTLYRVDVFLENITKINDTLVVKDIRKSVSTIVKAWCRRYDYDFDEEK